MPYHATLAYSSAPCYPPCAPHAAAGLRMPLLLCGRVLRHALVHDHAAARRCHQHRVRAVVEVALRNACRRKRAGLQISETVPPHRSAQVWQIGTQITQTVSSLTLFRYGEVRTPEGPPPKARFLVSSSTVCSTQGGSPGWPLWVHTRLRLTAHPAGALLCALQLGCWDAAWLAHSGSFCTVTHQDGTEIVALNLGPQGRPPGWPSGCVKCSASWPTRPGPPYWGHLSRARFGTCPALAPPPAAKTEC